MFKINEYNRHAVKTALYFLIFGFLWILLSDSLLHRLSPTPEFGLKMQTYKGGFFILITTLMIYLIVRDQLKVVFKLKDKLQESQKNYKQIVDLSHDLIWTVDNKGLISFINSTSEKYYGLKPEEMIGHKFSDFVEKEQYEKNLRIFEQNLSQGITSITYETTIKHKNGESYILSDNVSVVLNENGEVVIIIGASKDITQHKLYEGELLDNKHRLELALQGGELGMWDYNLQYNYFLVNDTWKQMLGIESDDNKIEVRFFGTLVHPDDAETINYTFNSVVAGEKVSFDIEHRIRHSDGKWRWVLSKGKVAVWDDQNKPLRIIGTNLDITTKKNLELELKYWLDVYSSFIKYANEGIFLHENEIPIEKDMPVDQQVNIFFNHGYIKKCNDSFAAMYGYQNSSEIEGFRLAQLQGGDDNPLNIAFLKKFINAGYRLNNEISYDVDKDGNRLYISNNLVGIHEHDKLVRIWGSQFNITEQVVARKKIEESEKRYRLLFENNPVPLMICDLNDFGFYDVNSAACKLFECSREKLLMATLKDIRPDVAFYSNEEIKILVAKEMNSTTEVTLKTMQQTIILAEVRTDQIEYEGKYAAIAAINDITPIREAEKMVIRSLIEGEDNERKRVAKEIHDSLGQNLTAASLNFSAIKSEIECLEIVKKEKFNLGISFLNSAIEESRNIAHNLMPKAIDDFGLVPSLKSLFGQIEKSAGLKITFYDNLRNNRSLPVGVELNLYRITQEALNNVLKHADADEIFVQLLLHTNEIIYTFEDDGKGFGLAAVKAGSKGMGLKSIANRVKAMAGTLEIDSNIGKGAAITIQIPYVNYGTNK
jgi:PAS domain S-box-containing protein